MKRITHQQSAVIVDAAVQSVCDSFQSVYPDQILGSRGQQHVSDARHAVFWLIRTHSRVSHQKAALALGRAYFLTSIHGVKCCQKLMDIDSFYQANVEDAQRRFLGKLKSLNIKPKPYTD